VRSQSAGKPGTGASAMNALAVVAQLRGDLDVAESLYGRAAALAAEAGQNRLSAMIDQNLGTMANIRGDLPTAQLRYQAALERFHQLGDRRSAAGVLNNMGMLYVDVSEYGSAELSFNAAYQLATEQSDMANQAKIDTNRAELYLKRQDYERARECCDRAFRIFTAMASHTGLANVHRTYGVLHRETGRPQVADMQLALALRLARSCDNKLSEAETENERARLFLADNRFRLALKSLNQAYKLFCELDARREILDLKRRLERMEEPYMHALQLWSEEEPMLRENRIGARGARVGELAGRLVRAIGQDSLLTTVRVGSFLHDVGVAAVPRGVISKAGPLTADERQIMQQHAVVGAGIVDDLSFPADVSTIVRHHHEHWDGSGYPDGLSGEKIPLLARIVCIADVFDALTSERPFRAALHGEKAMEVMAAEAGSTFDPNLFNLFRTLVGEADSNDILTVGQVVV
jgi:putative nucleotidyltransferase with HDIG domain